MLLLAGWDDDTVDPGNTLRLAARLRAAGGTVEDKLYPGVGHITLIKAFLWIIDISRTSAHSGSELHRRPW